MFDVEVGLSSFSEFRTSVKFAFTTVIYEAAGNTTG